MFLASRQRWAQVEISLVVREILHILLKLTCCSFASIQLILLRPLNRVHRSGVGRVTPYWKLLTLLSSLSVVCPVERG